MVIFGGKKDKRQKEKVEERSGVRRSQIPQGGTKVDKLNKTKNTIVH
jgi:hypothetical protein